MLCCLAAGIAGEKVTGGYNPDGCGQDNANAVGLGDRGVVAVGKKADLNVIDHDALRLHAPEMIFDLPAGGRRLTQRVDGYRYTVVAGTVTFENGEPTGARPGGLLRGHA